jgi:hypothetical protein
MELKLALVDERCIAPADQGDLIRNRIGSLARPSQNDRAESVTPELD